MTRFSIITVTRNNVEGLKKTATSVALQTFPDFEWIVVDGASTDSSTSFLTSCNVTQLQLISEPDAGIYDAMNKGINRATGDYLFFLNAGDMLATPETLSLVTGYADLIFGDSWEGGHYKRARRDADICMGMFTHHQAIFYRRASVGALRYNLTYRIAADYDFTLRFLKEHKITLYLPLPMCVFEQGGISQKQVAQGRIEQFRARKENSAVSPSKNICIYVLQCGLYMLRRYLPSIYWILKRL